jgi:hypothetical protein
MPVSKTAALEKRIVKLEQELAAYKRQLTQRVPGDSATARELRLRLVALRKAVHQFFDDCSEHDVRWNVHPDVSDSFNHLTSLALFELKAEATEELAAAPAPSKRTPR